MRYLQRDTADNLVSFARLVIDFVPKLNDPRIPKTANDRDFLFTALAALKTECIDAMEELAT